MTQEHRLVGIHAHRQASGTGQHDHRRAPFTHGGVTVQYWRCDLGTLPLRACPEGPDPVMLLIVKASQRPPSPPPRTVVALHKGGCTRPGHERAARIGGTYCRTCRLEQDRARRGAA